MSWQKHFLQFFERIAMKLVCLVCGTSTIFVIVERHLQQTAQTCYKLYLNREKTTSCSAGNDQILVVKRYFLVQRQILQVNVKLEIYIYTVYRWSDTTILYTNRGTWLKVSADEQKHIVATRKQSTSAVLWTLFSGGIFCCLFKWLLIFVNYLFWTPWINYRHTWEGGNKRIGLTLTAGTRLNPNYYYRCYY